MKDDEQVICYCFNPRCQSRENTDTDPVCSSCGSSLQVKNRYRLLKPLRPIDGPMPQEIEVFACVDTTGGEGVEAGTHQIIKILLVHDRFEPYDAKRVKLLYRESEVLKNVDHPGIPKTPEDGFFCLKDTGIAKEVYCLVQQKIEGQTLDQWLEEHGPISEKLALNWLKQLADSLHAVHQIGYFHRDIKPANIMIKADGNLVLIDFGAARDLSDTYLAKIGSAPLEDDYNHRLEVTTVFTAGYAPPEQLNGKGLFQSDFYALGCTFVHLLTGIHPSNLPASMDTGKLTWRDNAPQLSKPFADFLDKLMSIAPGKRPQNTTSLLHYLESSLPRKLRRHRLFHDRRFQLAAGIGAVLLLFAGYKGGTKLTSEYYFHTGSEHSFAGRYEQARKDLEFAIQLNPNNANAYTNLASTCQNLGDDDCTFDSFEKALEIDPNNWPVYSQIGGFYDFRNRNDEAAEYYQKAIDVGDGKAVEAMNNLGRIYILQEKYDKAIKLLTESIETTEKVVAETNQAPDLVASGYKNRGWANLELKRYDEALVDLEKSAGLNYQYADTYCLLEKVYKIKKDDEKANLNREICLTSQYTTPEAYEWKLAIIKQLNPQ